LRINDDYEFLFSFLTVHIQSTQDVYKIVQRLNEKDKNKLKIQLLSASLMVLSKLP
jgi:hypothetical protein